MKISTRGRYALRVMVNLAMHEKDSFIPLNAYVHVRGAAGGGFRRGALLRKRPCARRDFALRRSGTVSF